jgi:hypothetical protein
VISDEVRAWVAETRAKQGLPPTITDPTVLAELAAAVADTMVAAAPRGGDGRGEAA